MTKQWVSDEELTKLEEQELRTEEIGAVSLALQNPSHLWRSPEGIAAETGLPLSTVLLVLHEYRGQWMKHPVGAKDGRVLYSKWEHFSKKASWWEKFLWVVRLAR